MLLLITTSKTESKMGSRWRWPTDGVWITTWLCTMIKFTRCYLALDIWYPQEKLNLMINNIEIKSVNAQKHLGITIDSTMSWDQQISVVCLNVSRKKTLMKLLSKYVNQKSLKQYYNSYILPLLNYGCIVWGQTSSHNHTRLIKLKKRAAWLILRTDILTPSDELFKELN